MNDVARIILKKGEDARPPATAVAGTFVGKLEKDLTCVPQRFLTSIEQGTKSCPISSDHLCRLNKSLGLCPIHKLPTKNISTPKGETNEEQVSELISPLRGCCSVFLYRARRCISPTKLFRYQIGRKTRFRIAGCTTGSFLSQYGTNSGFRGDLETAERKDRSDAQAYPTSTANDRLARCANIARSVKESRRQSRNYQRGR